MRVSLMTIDKNVDVLVVGAGPTGIIMVNELLRRGVSVRWVEQRKTPVGTTRAFTVHTRTFEMLEHIGVAHKILEVNAISPGNRFHIEGLGLKPEEMPVLDFTKLQNTKYNFYGKVNQQDLEQILRDHVASQHNFHPEWGVKCESLKQTNSGIEVILDSNGNSEVIHPKYVIGADGVHSVVRHASGLDMKGEAYMDSESGDDGYFTMSMMDVPLAGYPGDSSWVNYHFSADDWMLITGLPDGTHRVYVSGELEKELLETDNPAEHARIFQKGLDRFAPGTKLLVEQTATSWKIFKKIADDYRKDNIFLCGDACHVRSPAGGQGANCCMQDAFNLAWKLALVIKGNSRESILDSYGEERKPVAEFVQSNAERIHHVLFDHNRTLEQRVQDTKDPHWHDELIYGISGLSHNYRKVIWTPEHYTPPTNGPVPGERAPNALLCETPLLRMDDIYRHSKATLVMLPKTEAEIEQSKTLLTTILNNYDESIKPVIICDRIIDGVSLDNQRVNKMDDIDKWFGTSDEGRVYLVRPDLYLGFVDKLINSASLEQYMNHWFLKS